MATVFLSQTSRLVIGLRQTRQIRFCRIDTWDFDELWLFAVDIGNGLHPENCAGISRFRRRGGGILVTRDHMDLGSSVCTLGGIGAAHWFHTRHRHPSGSVPPPDDRETEHILWPNFHSGANGDCQEVEAAGSTRPVLKDTTQPNGVLAYLPAHPHEGAMVAPPEDPSARVIATGVSKVSGDRFSLIVAFEPTSPSGPALAQSTFHHFADYNWDTARSCPDFVTEPPGEGMVNTPGALQSVIST